MANEQRLSIPSDISEVTPEWLTEALGDALPRAASVISARSEPMGEAGNLSRLTRVHLGYGPGASAAPASVVVKLASREPFILRQAQNLQLYAREVGFYGAVGSDCGTRVPRCYYVAQGDEDGQFVLVLEDITDAATVSQASGCAPSQAELAVRALAALHSRWWDSSSLKGWQWLPGQDSLLTAAWNEAFRRRLPLFLDRWAPHFDAKLGPALTRLANHLDAVVEGFYDRPLDTGPW